jgi:gluconolactonase
MGPGLIPGEFDPAHSLGGRIQRVDLATRRVEDLYTSCDGHPLRAPNDLVFDAHGGFYFTDHGIRDHQKRTSDLTAIYYAKADGSLIEEVVFPVEGPNGIGLSPDGKTLYWSETHLGRVCKRSIASPGKLVPIAPIDTSFVLCGLPGVQLLDSLAVDSEGNICVGTLVNGGITVISPEGEVMSHLATGDFLTTNICFGGPDLRTAYITLGATGKLVSTEWPRPGLKLSYSA